MSSSISSVGNRSAALHKPLPMMTVNVLWRIQPNEDEEECHILINMGTRRDQHSNLKENHRAGDEAHVRQAW
jgi:hypothetical protein